MLSYRHAFHAGNHADVIKHLVLVLTLEYYKSKDKPFFYLDTHSGSGIYKLSTASAQRTREYASGILAIWQAANAPAELQPYLTLVRQLYNNAQTLQHYPGSPWLAAQLLRPTDQMRLFELHPSDYQTLKQNVEADRRIQISKEDGLAGLIGLLPPVTRRAVTLIDPSYELKEDYTHVINALNKAHKRFATGTYLLWYPVITRQRVKQMVRALQQTHIPDIIQIELCTSADNEQLGMTGSGLFVVNPPWQLTRQMQTALPWLAQHMADSSGHFGIQRITPEK